MPDYDTLMLFLVASVALVITPGPDMLLVTSRSIAQGPRSGLATYLGIATGSYLHAAFLAVGLSQLFLALPFAYDVVRVVGAGYLLYLAWQAFTTPADRQGEADVSILQNTRVMFQQGLLTNVLNPKVALFFLALFPQFLNPEAGLIGLQIMILATILNVMGLIIYSGLIFIIAKSRRGLIGSSRVQRFAQRATGVIFVALAGRLVVDGGV